MGDAEAVADLVRARITATETVSYDKTVSIPKADYDRWFELDDTGFLRAAERLGHQICERFIDLSADVSDTSGFINVEIDLLPSESP